MPHNPSPDRRLQPSADNFGVTDLRAQPRLEPHRAALRGKSTNDDVPA
jgi:hypothetical protein